jgi:ComEC/Rec2-related protein
VTVPRDFSLLRARVPFLGLTAAALTGILLSDNQPTHWHFFAWLSLGISVAALIFRKTSLTLLTVLFSCGFLHSFNHASDQGFRLARRSLSSSYFLKALVLSDPVRSTQGSAVSERFFARVILLENRPADFRIVMEIPDARVAYGDILEGYFPLQLPSTSNNPGEFDYRGYLRRELVYLTSFVPRTSSHAIVARQRGNPLIGYALWIRHRAAETLSRGIEDDPEVCQVVQGIVLGSHTALATELMDALQRTGTLHLFVIDGLKVTLFAGFTWMLVCLLRIKRRLAALIVLPVITAYCFATGFSPSSLRATLMTGFLFTGIAVERPALLLNLLGAAGFLLLIGDTEEAFKIGFQLSFVTVLALVLLVRPLSIALVRPFEIDPYIPHRLVNARRRMVQHGIHLTGDLVAVSVVCWVSSLPMALIAFHRISLYSALVNLAAVPIGTWMLFTGVFSLVATPLCGWLGLCLNNTNWLLGKAFLWLVAVTSHFPGNTVNAAFPPVIHPTRMVVLSTGRIPVIAIHAGGKTWLINAGTESKWRRVVQPYLEFTGTNALEGILLGQSDKAHAGGLTRGLQQYPNTRLYRLTLSPSDLSQWEKRDCALTLTASPSISLSPLPTTQRKKQRGRQTPSALVGQFAGFRFFIGPEMTEQAINELHLPTLDLAILRSIKNSATLRPQLISHLGAVICEQKPDESTFPLQILVLSETGAITIVRSEKGLELHPFRGNQITLLSRSR